MSYQSTVYQVLAASPNDVAAERAAIQDVIPAWHALHSVEADGLVERYGTVAEFREKLSRHLTATVRRVLGPGETGPVPLPPPEESEETRRSNLELVRSQLSSALLRRERDWVTERDVEPLKLDDAKWILRSLASELLDFRVLLADAVDEGTTETLESAIRTAKALQGHQVYMDGGLSYRQFWIDGDTVFQAVHDVLQRLR